MLAINHNRCDRCGTCIAVCPADALYLSTKALSVNPSCTNCGRCVRVCPVAALSLEKGESA